MAESEGKKNTVDDFSDALIVEVSRFQLFTEIPDAYYLLSKPAFLANLRTVSIEDVPVATAKSS